MRRGVHEAYDSRECAAWNLGLLTGSTLVDDSEDHAVGIASPVLVAAELELESIGTRGKPLLKVGVIGHLLEVERSVYARNEGLKGNAISLETSKVNGEAEVEVVWIWAVQLLAARRRSSSVAVESDEVGHDLQQQLGVLGLYRRELILDQNLRTDVKHSPRIILRAVLRNTAEDYGD